MDSMIEKNTTNNVLFDTITYENIEHLDLFILNLSKEQALYVVNQALEMAHRRGAYTISESEILSKSLRILNKQIYGQEQSES